MRVRNNSKYVANTPSNHLESNGGTYGVSATTNVAKFKIFKNTLKYNRNPSLDRICPEPDFENVSDNVTSVLVDLNTCPATNDYQSLRNYPRGTYRANGSIPIDGHAPIFRQRKSKYFQKSQNQRYLGQQKIQGTLGPSLALECKCAFGATSEWSSAGNRTGIA